MSGNDRRGAGLAGRRGAAAPRRCLAEGQPRQRRRGRWGEFRDAYPRIVTGASIGIVVFLMVDVALAVTAWRFSRQAAAAQRAMTGLERQRADALTEVKQDRAALMAALVAQQADPGAGPEPVGLGRGRHHGPAAGGGAAPPHEGAVGPEATVGAAEDGVRLVPPRGKRQLVRVVDDSFVWSVPRWVFLHRGLDVPDDTRRALRGGLGPLALVLDDGTLIYSLPADGPLARRAPT